MRRPRTCRRSFSPTAAISCLASSAGTTPASISARSTPPTRTRIFSDLSAIGVGVGLNDQLFFVRNRALMTQRLDVASAKVVGDPILVAEDVATTGPTVAMAVSPKNDIVYWSGGRDITQLTWVRRDGVAEGTVGPPGGYMNVALSPDGRQAAVDRFDTDPAIWLIDVTRATMTRATFGKTYESTPVWAPDGKSFVFASAREAPPNLFLKRLDVTGDDQRLFRSTIQSFPQSWSRDGLIAFVVVDPSTHHDIWVVPSSGAQEPRPLIRTQFSESYARISPDGRWLAYVSNETGEPQRVRHAISGGGAQVAGVAWRRHLPGLAGRQPRAVLSGAGWETDGCANRRGARIRSGRACAALRRARVSRQPRSRHLL